jgi:hypothetical protein
MPATTVRRRVLTACLLLGAAMPACRAQDVPAEPAPDAMAVQPDPREYSTRADSDLMSQGNPRRFAGAGISWLGLVQGAGAPRPSTTYEIVDIFATLQIMNVFYVRAVSLGITAGCTECLVPAPGQINPAALSHFDQVLMRARDAGVKIVIPLAGALTGCTSDDAPDPIAGTACVFARWHHQDATAFYTDPAIRADFAAMVSKLLNHLNPLTGLTYKDDPVIMAWENCDGCGTGIDPKILADWTEFLGHTIKQIDTHHLYENGAFAGRLGKQPGAVATGLVALPSVDIVGDRVLPGIDAAGVGLADAADEVTNTKRIYMIDSYGWTPAQWPTPQAFENFLDGIVKNRSIAAAFVSDMSGHADTGGYLPAGPQGASLYFPGAPTPAAPADATQARARAVRRFAFHMTDNLATPFSYVGRPEIISVTHGKIVWRGIAGATTYSIARSTDVTQGGSWVTFCDQCVTDAAPFYQDPQPPSGPVWYRMQPFNANGHSGMYSAPVRSK